MSEQEQSKSNIGEKIMELLDIDSVYGWYNGEDEPRLSKDSVRGGGRRDLEQKCLMGEIPISDVFIMEALIKLSVATVDMIRDTLVIMKREMPRQNIVTPDRSGVKSRLNALCAVAIVYKHDFNYHGRRYQFYTLAKEGLYHWSHRTGRKCESYDQYLNQCSKQTLMGKLSASYVAVQYAMALGSRVKDISSNIMVMLSKAPVSTTTLSTKVYCKDSDNKKYLIHFEPLYFICDERIHTEKENLELLLERVRELQRRINYEKNEYSRDASAGGMRSYQDVKLVLIVENRWALGKAVELINTYAYELLNEVWFTTTEIVRDSGDVLKSFISIRVMPSSTGESEKASLKYGFTVAKHDILLSDDSEH